MCTADVSGARRALALVGLMTFAAGVVPAQVTTGSISGFVFDPSGRPIAGAAISVAGDRSLERQATSDSTGYYRLLNLPPAAYTLRVSAPRFADTEVAGARLTVNSNLRVDLHLAVAPTKQSITVTAPFLQTASSELGAVFEQPQIEALPLNRRSFLQLALLTPGVLPPVQDSELSTRGSFAMHANGAREEANNYLLDGVDNNDFDAHRYVMQPPIDAIQEFKIAVNNYTAEYGRSGGGQVNVITRAGSNNWHGFAYEYLRNRRLDARNYFDAGEKAAYIRNQFGGGIGGPLRKESTFFFFNADALRQRQGQTRLATVPTARARSGDLSESGTTAIDPFAQRPFPGNIIPTSRISAMAPKVLALFPQPHSAALSGNYLAQPTGTDSNSQFSFRVDHRFSAADQVAVRYSYASTLMNEPYAEQSRGVPGFGDAVQESGHNAMIQHTHVFSPRAIHSALLGVNRAVRQILPENSKTDVNRLWGVNWLPSNPVDWGYPAFNVAGYSQVGDVTQLPIDRAANTYQFTNHLSWIRGSHALRMGFEMRRQQHNGILDMFVRGSLSFSGAITKIGLGDLLLGIPAVGIQSQANTTQTLRSTATNGYAQDDWKATPTLTLNFGLRYEYNTPATDPTNRMSIFDAAQGQLAQVGTKGMSRSGYAPDKNNLAPRFGFAWSPDAKFVARGGYGVFYDTNMAMINTALYFNPPFFAMRIYFPTATWMPSLENPFPRNGGIAPAASLSTLTPDFSAGYLQHWNLNIQRQAGAGAASLAYAGSKGTHLIRSRDLNQPPPAAGALDSRRQYRNFGNIFSTESGGNSAFHSFQASYSRPLQRGFGLLAVYMLSKSIDDTTAFLGTTSDKNFPQDSRSFGLEHALSSFDTTHRATAALIWRIPGRGRLTRNFEISSIVVVESGQPFTPILRFDNSNTGNSGGQFGSDRPNLLRNPEIASPDSNAWFDVTAFAVPPKHTFGSAGRNILRGPGVFNTDFAVMRRFRVHEGLALTVHAQAFNLFNRTNFSLPELYADEPGTFARIFSAKTPRQAQFAMRLTF